MTRLEELKRRFRATLKSPDTEEGIDVAFYRPIGFAWACVAARLGISPNAITIASIFLGVGAGVAFYFDIYWVNLVGIFLLVWANSFDSADGQLARMTGRYSRLGRILDGMAGDLWFLTIYLAICLRETHTSHFFETHHWAIWVLAALAGLSHVKQAALADYYRQFHLHFVKLLDGEGRSELESSPALRRQLASMPWKGHFWRKLVLTFYARYTESQEAHTRSMQRLRRAMALRWPDGNVPRAFCAEFRRQSLPLMKWTNVLTFNWRSFILFAAILCRMPWIYFAVELTVGTGLAVMLNVRHERLCRRLLSQINSAG